MACWAAAKKKTRSKTRSLRVLAEPLWISSRFGTYPSSPNELASEFLGGVVESQFLTAEVVHWRISLQIQEQVIRETNFFRLLLKTRKTLGKRKEFDKHPKSELTPSLLKTPNEPQTVAFTGIFIMRSESKKLNHPCLKCLKLTDRLSETQAWLFTAKTAQGQRHGLTIVCLKPLKPSSLSTVLFSPRFRSYLLWEATELQVSPLRKA